MFFVPIDRQTTSSSRLVEHLGGLLFGGRHFCAEDSFAGLSGLYCGDFLAVSILVCVRRGRRALNGSVLLLVMAYLS